MSDTRVICLGNPLMGDDGIGPAVYDRLRQLPLPGKVELIDGGTAGLALLDLFADAGRVILVDAVDMGLPAGTVREFQLDQVVLSEQEKLSWHQAGLAEVLLLAREMELLPEDLLVIGVQPERVERLQGLSGKVGAAVTSAVATVMAQLDATG